MNVARDFRGLLACLVAALTLATTHCPASTLVFDRFYVIVLENRGFDEALDGRAPFLRELSETEGLATNYFGVTHPSLPNYLAMIAGDDFGVRDDAPSCLASDVPYSPGCHLFDAPTLVDQLERRGLTWRLYSENLVETDPLVSTAPSRASALYVQKHNPFAYFRGIADASARRTHFRSFDAFKADLEHRAPNFAFIVPNQCDDGHGLLECLDSKTLDNRMDHFVEATVAAIRASRNWSMRSAIVITFDEGETTDAKGGRVATIIIVKCGGRVRLAKALDHYSVLATIEDSFGLDRLRKAAGADSMTDLMKRVPGRCRKEAAH